MPSSNFLVCILHTGVSSEGTTLKRRAFAGVLPMPTTSNVWETQAKSGALSPAFNFFPIRLTGFPLKVTAPACLSIDEFLRRWKPLAASQERRAKAQAASGFRIELLAILFIEWLRLAQKP